MANSTIDFSSMLDSEAIKSMFNQAVQAAVQAAVNQAVNQALGVKAPKKTSAKTSAKKMETPEERKARIEARHAIPSSLAAAIIADSESGKKYFTTKAAWYIFQASEGDASKMVASDETIARLRVAYGIGQ